MCGTNILQSEIFAFFKQCSLQIVVSLLNVEAGKEGDLS